MYEEVFEDGQEYVVVDGVKMPVYQTDPDHKRNGGIGCANCDWHSMSEEEREKFAASMQNIIDEIGSRRRQK